MSKKESEVKEFNPVDLFSDGVSKCVNDDPSILASYLLPVAVFVIGLISLFGFAISGSLLGSVGISLMVFIPVFLILIFIGVISLLVANGAVVLKAKHLKEGEKLPLIESYRQALPHVPRLFLTYLVIFGIDLAILLPLIGSVIWVASGFISKVRSLTGAITGMASIESSNFTSNITSNMPQLSGESLGAISPAAIGGILLLFVVTVIVLYFVNVKLSLAPSACVLNENIGIGESWNLTKGHWWQVFVIMLIFGVISFVLNQIPFAIGSIFALILIPPVQIAVLTFAYLDLKQIEGESEE